MTRISRISLCVMLSAAAMAGADVPRRAPGFALPDSKMKVYDLYDYRGKLVVLEFMQTGCPHCATFAGVLEKVQQKYGEKVQILAVANSLQDNQNTVAEYAQGHNVRYPILFDSGQMAYSYILTQRFDLPQVFLIDAGGVIRRQYEYGPLTRDIFEGNGLFTEIDRLLAAGAPGQKQPQKRK